MSDTPTRFRKRTLTTVITRCRIGVSKVYFEAALRLKIEVQSCVYHMSTYVENHGSRKKKQ